MQQNIPDSLRAAWETGYCNRGRRYGGAPPDLPSLPGLSRVLETGCGDGKSLLAMAGRGWEIVAIDFSREAIRISSGNQALHKVMFIQADARSLPFRNDCFDAVFLSHLISHIPQNDRDRALSETERVLVSGGLVFLRVFSVRDFRAGKGCCVEPNTYLRGDGIRTHYFTSEEVESLFPGLTTRAIRTTEWTMKVKGERLIRSEIVAEFRK
jgi:ubiquinone/menaquinone biosynthesis C-methylase UbiE